MSTQWGLNRAGVPWSYRWLSAVWHVCWELNPGPLLERWASQTPGICPALSFLSLCVSLARDVSFKKKKKNSFCFIGFPVFCFPDLCSCFGFFTMLPSGVLLPTVSWFPMGRNPDHRLQVFLLSNLGLPCYEHSLWHCGHCPTVLCSFRFFWNSFFGPMNDSGLCSVMSKCLEVFLLFLPAEF